MKRGAALLLFLLALPLRGLAARPPLEVHVRAALGFEAPHATGTATFRWRNDAPGPASRLRFRLFANRFRQQPEELNDLSRHLLLAGGTYRRGGTEVLSVREGSRDLPARLEPARALAEGTVLVADLGREVAPGESVTVAIDFATTLPNLFDVFGASEGLVVAAGGWHPEALSFGDSEQPPAIRRLTLSLPSGGHLLAGGLLDERARTVEAASGEDSLVVLAREPFAVRRRIAGGRVIFVSFAEREIRHRISVNPPAEAALVETLAAIVPGSPRRLTVVRLPLRWYATWAAPGTVFVSDRLFEIHPLLRPVHQRELAYAVYLAEELAKAHGREAARDARWVAEGLAWRRAERFYREKVRAEREVQDWIRLFDVFAVVDRFETAPRIPFVRPFFPVLASDEPLSIRPETERRPPGRLLFSKLKTRLGAARFHALLARYAAATEPFREALRGFAGEEGQRFVDAWLAPYPEVNYAVDERRIVRESAEPRPDTVEVAIERDASVERRRVNLDQGESVLDLGEVESVTVDPDRRTIETRLDDDRRPARPHFLLDSSDVEVSSTEFGFSTLFVARREYDYRKDLAAAPFVTNRGYGVNLGFQLHGGHAIDRNLFRHNLFAYYRLERLDADFRNQEAPEVRTSGPLAGLGLRYNFFDAFWFENPSRSHHLRIFFDGYDRSFGSRFDFVQGGASLALTRPLRSDAILAAEVTSGFTAPTRGGSVPNQGLFSLGGFRSIRGIDAEEKLAENIFLLRGELRWLAPIHLDLNFQEALTARRLQLRAFVDAGRVSDSRERLYDPSGFAVGAGAGFNLFYDFLGFFPSSFYLDFATRVDRREAVQVLFGGRQPF